MNKIKIVLGIAVLFMGVTACSSSPEQELSQLTTEQSAEQQARLSELDYRCERIAQIGSHIPQKRCTTAAQREKEREIAEEYSRDRASAMKAERTRSSYLEQNSGMR